MIVYDVAQQITQDVPSNITITLLGLHYVQDVLTIIRSLYAFRFLSK